MSVDSSFGDTGAELRKKLTFRSPLLRMIELIVLFFASIFLLIIGAIFFGIFILIEKLYKKLKELISHEKRIRV